MRRRPSLISRMLIGAVFFFLYAPIFILILFSFNNSKSRSVWSGFTLAWYEKLFQDELILEALYTTLAVSVLASVIATVVGTFAAIGFYHMKRRWRTPLMTINNIPLINADIVTGVSMCIFFVAFFNGWSVLAQWLNEQVGTHLPIHLYLGFGTMLIAHITFNVPYVILSVMPKLRQMDKNLVDAAQDLGCTWLQAFWKVVLPEIKPGVINGLLIAFTMSVDDFVISYFTAGSTSNLAMHIYAMTKKPITPEVNAVSTLLFLTVLILLIIVNLREAKQEKLAAKEGSH